MPSARIGTFSQRMTRRLARLFSLRSLAVAHEGVDSQNMKVYSCLILRPKKPIRIALSELDKKSAHALHSSTFRRYGSHLRHNSWLPHPPRRCRGYGRR
ncbi:hypothetical protein BGY98DRAFT_968742 [Russula aff. rugulosa BPL654]|nr:hypothetical protein BGY98DRAFT_968742 [Russula aff. rugulosa BPL654]